MAGLAGIVPLRDTIESTETVTLVEKMAREFTLGIVSMAPRDEIELVLDRGGMRKHFSVIVSAEAEGFRLC